MGLSRLVYVSEPVLDPARGSTMSQLAAIMATSNRNNQAVGVTGALAYEGSWFLQVLEGERRAVWKTFQRICEDDRHAECLMVEMCDVTERLFGNWWMGAATRDAVTAPAFAPFLANGMLRADAMSGADVLALMVSLARVGLRRELRVAA